MEKKYGNRRHFALSYLRIVKTESLTVFLVFVINMSNYVIM